jgi:outer membrane cobalamin receptor
MGQSEETPPPESTQHVAVTGTRLSQAAAQSAQDVHTYDRERIERSGQTSVADFLATVPEASLNSLESTYIGTSVRLRGTVEGSTLILVNGRRTQAVTGGVAPFGFFDLNTIPLSMVERIDVLPSSSSAIYGGEALAGVVNIILRSDFQGAEGTLSYKSANDTDEKASRWAPAGRASACACPSWAATASAARCSARTARSPHRPTIAASAAPISARLSSACPPTSRRYPATFQASPRASPPFRWAAPGSA